MENFQKIWIFIMSKNFLIWYEIYSIIWIFFWKLDNTVLGYPKKIRKDIRYHYSDIKYTWNTLKYIIPLKNKKKNIKKYVLKYIL